MNHRPELEIGKLRQLIPQRDWFVCCFALDELHRFDPFEVGQNVSVGLAFHPDDPTVPYVGEVSIVRRGRVPGAQITRVELDRKPASPAAARVNPSAPHAAEGDVIYEPSGVLVRRNIGKVLAVGGQPVGRTNGYRRSEATSSSTCRTART